MSKLSTSASLNVARLLYLLVCELAGMALAYQAFGADKLWIGIAGGLAVAAFFIMVESLMTPFTLRGFSTATFGLLVGLFCAWLLTRVGIPSLIQTSFDNHISHPEEFSLAFNAVLYASFGFLGTVLALRSSQDDFAFIIPYVRFRQDSTAGRPILLDGESITDGRLTAVIDSGFLERNLIIPRFVLDELQVMSNSPSPGRRQRGQRGLDTLEELRSSKLNRITIHDTDSDSGETTHDTLLLQISQLLNARLLTTDSNLTKVARLQGAEVLNLNQLSDSLKQKISVGARLHLPIVRTGKEEHQGVGYLSDGTMIVVNNAVSKIGTTQDVTVISTINTSAGLMVFAEMDGE